MHKTDMFNWMAKQAFSCRWESQPATDYIAKKMAFYLQCQSRPVRKRSRSTFIAPSINHFNPEKHIAYYNDDVMASTGL